MKNIKLIFLALLTGSSIISSCSKKFLTHLPQGALSEDVLATQKGVEGLLVGAYGALNGQRLNTGQENWASSPDNWLYGSVCGGDAHKGSIGGDQIPMNAIMNFTLDAANPFFSGKWRADYEGISRCNMTLKVLAQVTDIPDNVRTSIEAQARFLRAYYYFDLKNMFNMVPWVDETTTNFNQPNNVDIWPNIEADLDFAMKNLTEMQDAIGKVNKWAAATYLAKAYLFQHKYQEAKSIFDQVIQSGKTSNGIKYALTAKLQDNWRPELETSNPEAVFAIQEATHTGTGDISQSRAGDILNYPYPNSPWCCGFFQPSQDLVNSYRTNDVTGLPYLDDYNQHGVKSDMGIGSDAAFTPDNGPLDPRLDWTVGRRGIPYLDWGLHPGKMWIRDQPYSGPYSGKKNLFWQANRDQFYDALDFGPGTAVNYVRTRFAQVLLMAAECEAQLGNFDKAEEYVNKIRSRAADPDGWVYTYEDVAEPMGGFTNTPAANYFVKPYPEGYFASVGKEGALKAIYFEEKLELAMEGHRFFDLVRWGLAAPTLNAYLQFEGSITTDMGDGHFTAGKNEYFPVPQSEIDLSVVGTTPALTQNQGY